MALSGSMDHGRLLLVKLLPIHILQRRIFTILYKTTYFTKVLVKLLKYAVAFNELCIAYANYSAIWILIFEW